MLSSRKTFFAIFVVALIFSIKVVGAFFGGTNARNIDEKDGLLVLTTASFDDAIKQYKSVLVNFYPTSTECPACDHVTKEFIAAAKILEEENEKDIRLATVDISNNAELKDKFKIINYPAVRYFQKGEEEDAGHHHGHYIGSWHSHTIVAWLKKKVGQSAYRKIYSSTELEEFVGDNEAAVIGVFRDPKGKEAKAFVSASQKVLDDGVNFALVIPDKEMLKSEFKDNKQNAKIYIMKKYDDLLVAYDPEKPMDDAEEIIRFVRLRAFPYVVEFTPGAEDIQRTFGNAQIHIHLAMFASKKTDAKLHSEMRVAAQKLKPEFGDKLTFAFVDTSTDENNDWLKYFFIDKTKDIPQVMITKLDGAKRIYRMKLKENDDGSKETIDATKIGQFVKDFFDDKLEEDWSSYHEEL